MFEWVVVIELGLILISLRYLRMTVHSLSSVDDNSIESVVDRLDDIIAILERRFPDDDGDID